MTVYKIVKFNSGNFLAIFGRTNRKLNHNDKACVNLVLSIVVWQGKNSISR